MGKIREVDAISDAIVATEREIAGDAWGNEDTDPADETGDRTLESMGEGLEGQHEAEDDDDAGSEEQEGDEESEGEDGDETEGAEAEADATGETGEGEQPPAKTAGEQRQGRVPSGKLREANERARTLETERNNLKTEIEALRAAGGNKGEIDVLKTQVATLTQLLQPGNRQGTVPAKEEKPVVPDIFENPTGFVEHLEKGFETRLNGVINTIRNNTVSMSFELAHVKHSAAFENAMAAVNKLDPNNPSDREVVQGIYNSPNPGESLVRWHKRNETLARVGSDPAAYEERIRNETRQSLLKDPEFHKELMASMRGEAQTGNNGSPRSTTRLPPSLSRTAGASSRGDRVEHSAFDDSEQGVADAAWR